MFLQNPDHIPHPVFPVDHFAVTDSAELAAPEDLVRMRFDEIDRALQRRPEVLNIHLFPAGVIIAAAGSVIVWMNPGSILTVLGGLVVRSVGSLPMYLMSALQADALDCVERQSGFRADSCSASFASIIQAVVLGIVQTVLLTGINLAGYIVPGSAAQVIAQPDSVRNFFNGCFAGFPAIGYLICAGIMLFTGSKSNAK